jgi:folate-binding protein YgfZ
MSGKFYLAPKSRGLLQIAGEDRRTFLQGLISNDVMLVDGGRAIYASLLTAQGRFLHDFFVTEFDDGFFLDAEAERIDDLKRRLSLYRLRSKVTLAAPIDTHRVAILFGDDALRSLDLPQDPGRAMSFAGGVVYVDPRLTTLGARAILPSDRQSALEHAGFVPGDPEAYEALRLALGVPDGSRDLPVEKALLLENGFDELHGVDWKKGCYVGQELTARMKYRALIRKRLMPVRVDGTLPRAGTPIMLGDQEAGEMRSGHGQLGLALLRLDMVEQAEREARHLTADGASLTPVRPAWAEF